MKDESTTEIKVLVLLFTPHNTQHFNTTLNQHSTLNTQHNTLHSNNTTTVSEQLLKLATVALCNSLSTKNLKKKKNMEENVLL